MRKPIHWHTKGVLNSYTQVFFSDSGIFAALLIPVSFLDFYAGLFGLFAVLAANGAAYWLGFDKLKIQSGYYGFNALLVGLGLGIQFQPGWLLVLIVLIAAVLTLFAAVALEGVIGKYGLPQLSLPFVLALWALILASREFQFLGLNERGIYTLNDLYIIGGAPLVRAYEWWNSLPIPTSWRAYFLSLGAIFFQYSIFTGLLIATGLLLYSRIAFSLSLLGFFSAYWFYGLIGAEISEATYSYIGFNYILTAIAIGGFFIIPGWSSYLWTALIIPMVAILTISLSAIFAVFGLPIYSLPFNIVTLTFLYALKFRLDKRAGLSTIFVQRNAPEKNLYSFVNYQERFGKESPLSISLPFYGEWEVTQGHDGAYTHQSEWRHAWDFEIRDESGKTYKGAGDYPADYYCYDKNVTAPADGVVEEVVDGIEDNIIGDKNLEYNWGNTLVIKHLEYLYTKMSHLKSGSIALRPGDRVKKGDLIGKCGNSGNSPYPHLHFQIQATPYIGSPTLDYPLSNVYVQRNSEKILEAVSVPGKGDLVSNVQVDPALRKAFYFIPGERIRFRVDNDELIWDVRLDYYLNKYLECRQTGSRAYFRLNDAMLHFLHFEGDRRSLLYSFYLSAYKVSFGHYKGLTLRDTFPVNMVFPPNRTGLQDFIAPFYRYLSASYTLTYPVSNRDPFNRQIKLEGHISKAVLGRVRDECHFSLQIDARGLCGFTFEGKRQHIQATCFADS